MRSILHTLLMTLLLAVCSDGQTAPAKSAEPAPKPAKPTLAAGHSILLQLKAPAEKAKDFDAIYTISQDGTIKVPYLPAAVHAAGLTETELVRRLEAVYREAGVFKEPAIMVGVRGCGGGGNVPVVIVGGAVKSGGREVPCKDGMRLFAAITAAGGFTGDADMRQIKVLQGAKETIYDLRKIAADQSNNPILRAGDMVVVPDE